MRRPARPEADRALDRGPLKPLLPLYAAAFLVVMAGTEAVVMSSAGPGAARLATFAALGGCLLSMGMRRHGRSGLLGGLLIVLALLFAGLRAAQYAPGALLYPAEVAAEPDLLLAMTFAWINAGYCFALRGPGRFSFTIVPTLAIFGLAAPLNLSTEMVLDFMVYLFASIFLLGYEGALERDLNLGRRLREAHLRVAYSRLAAAALVFVIVAGSSVLAAPWLARVSPQIFSTMARHSARMLQALNIPNFSRLDRTGFFIGKGPIHLDPAPVMRIRADRGGLWRGLAYDRYTGSGWRQSDRRARGARLPGGPRDLRPLRGMAIVGPRREVRQVVEPLNIVGTTAFALAEPERVQQRFTTPGTARVLVDSFGCVAFSRLLVPGGSYVVWSQVPAGDAESLREAEVATREDIGENYFELPMRTRRVAEGIAERITEQAETPFERAEAIRRYVAENHEYTLEGPFVAMQRDAVVDFLTYQRSGACDLFASAFVVLARAAELPARIATGYAHGEYLPAEQAFLVRGTDAHAWAEVYFQGHGWIAFDPTVGASAERPGLLPLLGIGQYWRFVSAVLRQVVLTAAAVGLFILAVTSLVDLRSLAKRVSVWWQRRGRGHVGELEAAYLSACRQVARAGWRRAEWQTPGEFARTIEARAGPQGRLAWAPLRLATQALQRVKYGAKTISGEEMEALWRRVRRMRHFVRRLPQPDA